MDEVFDWNFLHQTFGQISIGNAKAGWIDFFGSRGLFAKNPKYCGRRNMWNRNGQNTLFA